MKIRAVCLSFSFSLEYLHHDQQTKEKEKGKVKTPNLFSYAEEAENQKRTFEQAELFMNNFENKQKTEEMLGDVQSS